VIIIEALLETKRISAESAPKNSKT